MTVPDVMEVTTMPMAVRQVRGGVQERDLLPDSEYALGLETLDDVDVDAAFAEIVLGDDELVDLEFEALVRAEFGGPPEPSRAPHDDAGDASQRPMGREARAPRPTAAVRTGPARRRNRQRSPPARRRVLS